MRKRIATRLPCGAKKFQLQVFVHAANVMKPVSTTVESIIIVLQDLKNIKNVKGCRDGMPKSMQTR